MGQDFGHDHFFGAQQSMGRAKTLMNKVIYHPMTARGKLRIINTKWKAQRENLPEFSPRDVSKDFRSFLSNFNQLTAADVYIAKHVKFHNVRAWKKSVMGIWVSKNYARAGIDTKSLWKSVADDTKRHNLSLVEGFMFKRSIRGTLSRLKMEGAGARPGLFGRNKVLLTWEQQFDYRWHRPHLDRIFNALQTKDKTKHSWGHGTDQAKEKAQWWEDEWERRTDGAGYYEQNEHRENGNGQYGQRQSTSNGASSTNGHQPQEDPNWFVAPDGNTTRKPPQSAAKKADNPKRESQGQPDYGTRQWAEQAQQRFEGVGQDMEPDKNGFLHVSLRGNERKGNAPLQDRLKPSTQAQYQRIKERLDDIPLETLPIYLVERANAVSRSSWWSEHAVIRRDLRASEKSAQELGLEATRKQLYQLRRGVEEMDYKTLRTEPRAIRQQLNRQPISNAAFERLLESSLHVDDMELHDILLLSKATGARPAELHRGVFVQRNGNTSVVHITTAKKSAGVDSERPHFAAQKGIDRSITTHDIRITEIADRSPEQDKGTFFLPSSTPNDVRLRLQQLRAHVPGAEHASLYTFRHMKADQMRSDGRSDEFISQQLGHRGPESANKYGNTGH